MKEQYAAAHGALMSAAPHTAALLSLFAHSALILFEPPVLTQDGGQQEGKVRHRPRGPHVGRVCARHARRHPLPAPQARAARPSHMLLSSVIRLISDIGYTPDIFFGLGHCNSTCRMRFYEDPEALRLPPSEPWNPERRMRLYEDP